MPRDSKRMMHAIKGLATLQPQVYTADIRIYGGLMIFIVILALCSGMVTLTSDQLAEACLLNLQSHYIQDNNKNKTIDSLSTTFTNIIKTNESYNNIESLTLLKATNNLASTSKNLIPDKVQYNKFTEAIGLIYARNFYQSKQTAIPIDLPLEFHKIVAGGILATLLQDPLIQPSEIEQNDISRPAVLGVTSSQNVITYIESSKKQQVCIDIATGSAINQGSWDIPEDYIPMACGISSDNLFMYRIIMHQENSENFFELCSTQDKTTSIQKIPLPQNTSYVGVTYNSSSKTFGIIVTNIKNKNLQFVFYNTIQQNYSVSKSFKIPSQLTGFITANTDPTLRGPFMRTDRTKNHLLRILDIFSFEIIDSLLIGINPMGETPGGLQNGTIIIYNISQEKLDGYAINQYKLSKSSLIILQNMATLQSTALPKNFIPDYADIINQKIQNFSQAKQIALIQPGNADDYFRLFDFTYMRYVQHEKRSSKLQVFNVIPPTLSAALHVMHTLYSQSRDDATDILNSALYVMHKELKYKFSKPSNIPEVLKKVYGKEQSANFSCLKPTQPTPITPQTSSWFSKTKLQETLASIRRGTISWWGKAKDFCSRYPILCVPGITIGLSVVANYIFNRFHGITPTKVNPPAQTSQASP